VTISLRRFSPLAAMRFAAARRSSLAIGSALVVSVALLGSSAPALAVVTTVEATTVGLQPRNTESVLDGVLAVNELGDGSYFAAPQSFENPAGNPVLHKSETFAIYWDPANRYHGDWQHLINGFLQNVGSDSGTLGNDFAVDTQYTDKSNAPAYYHSTYRAAPTDTNAYPSSGCTDPDPISEYQPFKTEALACLTDQQVREQLQTFIAQNNLPKGMSSIFYVLTPPGVTVCLDSAATHCSDYEDATGRKHSFCSYHSDINPDETEAGDGNTVLYAVLPWTAGGDGDGQLAEVNHTAAFDCQDGGFDPTKHESKEHPKERNVKEEEEYENKSKEEKKEANEALALQNPHEQEPNQVTPCPSYDGYCDTGLADLIIGQMGEEQQNIVTDPLLNAWHDAANDEATDECRNFFASGELEGSSAALPGSLAGTLANQKIGSGRYYLDNAFDRAALKLAYPGIPCVAGDTLLPQFTAPNTVNTGESVGFDGMESDISLGAATRYSSSGTPEESYATYSWNFGDGTPEVSGFAPGAPACESPWLSPCAASVLHSYQYGGIYEVTLTVTDVGGNVARTVHDVAVDGPPPPPPPTTTGSGAAGSTGQTSGTTGTTGSGSGTTTTPGAAAIVPNPVALAAVISRSLRTVLRKGLVIRYSVNEQIAGHFEVLLDRVTARRLGISGAPALGLAAGTPPELVIAKAILVTTKGGRSSVSIQFSKRTAARLARLHTVKLMLRLVVRNSSPVSPASTTVLSSFTLSH
jgi:PKD domain